MAKSRDTTRNPPGVTSELALPGLFPDVPNEVQQRFSTAANWDQELKVWWRKVRGALSSNDETLADSISTMRRQITVLTSETGAFRASASQQLLVLTSEVDALAAAVLELSVSAGTKTSIGTTAPPTPSDGDIWWKVEDGQITMFRWNGTTNQWEDVTDTRIPIISANLLSEQMARINADEALALDLTALSAYVNGDLATAIEQLQVDVGPSGALASQLTALTADFNDYSATTNSTLSAQADDISANAGSIILLEAALNEEVGNRVAAVLSEANARVSGDNALSDRIDALVVASGSGIQTYLQNDPPDDYPNLNTGDLWFDLNDGLRPYRWSGTEWIPIRDGEIAVVMAAVISEQEARIDEDEALALDITTLTTRLDSGDIATAISGLEAYAGPGGTTATALTELSSNFGNFQSSATTTLNTHTSQIGSMSSQITTLNSRVNTKNSTWIQASAPSILGTPGTAAVGDLWINTSNNWRLYRASNSGWVDVTDTRIPALQSAVSAETTTRATADGFLSGKYTMTVAAGNVVTGMQITSASAPNGGTVSEVKFQADKFQIWNGSTGLAPFTVSGGVVRITGSLVIEPSDIGDGLLEVGGAAGDVNAGSTTIQGSKITTSTITALQIAAGTITSAEIAANTITANNILAGTITGARIAANTITATNIAANTITADRLAALLIITNTIRSNNYVANSAGWQITGTTAEFNNVTVRGTIHSTVGTIGGWTLASNRIQLGSSADATTYLNPTVGYRHTQGNWSTQLGSSTSASLLSLWNTTAPSRILASLSANSTGGTVTVNAPGTTPGATLTPTLLMINGFPVVRARYTAGIGTLSGVQDCLRYHGLAT